MFRLFALLPKVIYRIRGACFRLLVLLAGGRCGAGLRLEPGLRLRQGLHAGLQFGTDVYIGRNCTIDCLPGATLSVGSNATVTEGLFVSVCSTVTIGDDCLIGEYCSIRDANHETSDLTVPITKQAMASRPITIGGNVWIGRGCAILAGATVGQGAVVGANSVVTGEVPGDMIVAGIPARPLRSRRSL